MSTSQDLGQSTPLGCFRVAAAMLLLAIVVGILGIVFGFVVAVKLASNACPGGNCPVPLPAPWDPIPDPCPKPTPKPRP